MRFLISYFYQTYRNIPVPVRNDTCGVNLDGDLVIPPGILPPAKLAPNPKSLIFELFFIWIRISNSPHSPPENSHNTGSELFFGEPLINPIPFAS